MSSEVIYQITYEDVQDRDVLYRQIYSNEHLNYYITDDFSKDFYVYLASCGFISTSVTLDDKFYLLPEMQFEYSILDFENLNISKSISKLIDKNLHKFSINTNIDEVLNKLQEYHKNNWLTGKYKDLIKELYKEDFEHGFEVLSIELYDEKTNELIAGEIGYKIGSTYTSLTGFSLREKEYKNWGKLQLVLLALYLKENNYSFWNLGHPYMQYKLDLGAKTYKRLDFLKRWLKHI